MEKVGNNGVHLGARMYNVTLRGLKGTLLALNQNEQAHLLNNGSSAKKLDTC